MHIAAHARHDERLEQAIALLSSLLAGDEPPVDEATPWQQAPLRAPTLLGRVSATDRLSWWFRPSDDGGDSWDTYFAEEPVARVPMHPAAAPQAPPPDDAPLGRRAALRLLLAEPEEELIDADGEAVVTCLYDFVHAIGRRDVTAAIESCVAPDYHALEGDVELDRDGLATQLRAELDRLRGWEIETSLLEIPEPILHPDGILVYTELQIDARKGELRQTNVHRRIAVFRQARDRTWLISALSPP